MRLETLSDLYLEQLRDLYSAETQIIDALPAMVKKASHPELRQAFQQHLDETKRQHDRLEQIFDDLGKSPKGETCKAMQGLVKEASEMLGKSGDSDVIDAGMIASAQRIEHYEIAGYGTVATYAEMLGRMDDKRILGNILEEEEQTDQMLNRIAKSVVNPEAMQV
ncbi:MAG TPA: ferritin-like domain-containing protein [Rhodothermales bacterium]|nr:ferritin-like domain-containing protein [Rhodothermales bacterium]